MKKTDLSNPVIYSQGDNGKAILILHGFSAHVREIDFLFRYFQKKGFSVARPILKGHESMDALLGFDPVLCKADIAAWIDYLHKKYSEVHVVAISFGGNLLISACEGCIDKIKTASFLEMPVFFRPKIYFMLGFTARFLNFLGVKKIKKGKLIYRKGYTPRQESFPYLPVKACIRLHNFIRKDTIKKIKNFNRKCLLVYSQKSDLISVKTIDYLNNNLASKEKELEIFPIDNHDFDVLDDSGKIVLMERIYKFINNS